MHSQLFRCLAASTRSITSGFALGTNGSGTRHLFTHRPSVCRTAPECRSPHRNPTSRSKVEVGGFWLDIAGEVPHGHRLAEGGEARGERSGLLPRAWVFRGRSEPSMVWWDKFLK